MLVHDWTQVEHGLFHDFHLGWVVSLRGALNDGRLPADHYALVEWHVGRPVEDILSLSGPGPFEPSPAQTDLAARRRSLAIRHVSGHRLVALVEIVSPANKDRPRHVEDFAAKVVSALDAGVHVVMVDLFPPGPHDPHGMHEVIQQRLEGHEEPYDLPPQEPLTQASYVAGPRVDIYLEHLAPGAMLPEMPLFVRPDRYVGLPLAETYDAAYRGLPAFWKDVLEGRPPA